MHCAQQEYDAVVYVIPVENYGSEGDFFHLKYILNQVKFKKIVFAINMMDTCNFEDDSVCEIMDNVKSHLMEHGYEDSDCVPDFLPKQGCDSSKRSRAADERC